MGQHKHPNWPYSAPIRVGRNKRQLGRAFIGYGPTLSTRQLMEMAYPRARVWAQWQWREIRRCADRLGLVRVDADGVDDRGRPRRRSRPLRWVLPDRDTK
jgi:hypothetical protein